MYCTSGRLPYQNNIFYCYFWCYPMIISVILCPPDLVLLVRSGPVIRDLGGSVRIWGDNGPVLISYFYDGAVPVKVFQNRSQSDFYMDNLILIMKSHQQLSFPFSIFVMQVSYSSSLYIWFA